MPSSFIVIPISCLVIATIFSPINLYANPNNGNYPANQFQLANGTSIIYGNSTYINIGLKGIQYSSSSSIPTANAIACENLTINRNTQVGTNKTTPTTIGQVPVIGWLINQNGVLGINILRNFQEFITGLGAKLVGHNNIANACFQESSQIVQGNIISIKYDGQDLILLFIDLLLVVMGAVVLVSFLASGGGAYVAFIIGALVSVWLVLSLFAYPTFSIIPEPFGSSIYIILTLGFTIGSIDLVGGGKAF